jgi:hypothetical protein
MDGRFLEAFTLLPKQRELCGRVTKPLCLRHRIVLEAIKSPFVNAENLPTINDIIIFSKIVSSYDMAEMMPKEPDENDKKWVRKMADDFELQHEQAMKCFECIGEQSKWPVFWKKKSIKSNGVPWALGVVCNLSKNGVPLESAWTMPESQAIWMNAAFAIGSGADIDIVSDEDLAIQKFMDKMKQNESSETEEELTNVS